MMHSQPVIKMGNIVFTFSVLPLCTVFLVLPSARLLGYVIVL